MLINLPSPLIIGEGLRHDCNPSVARSDFILIPGTAIHITLEATIHIAGIRTCRTVL
jgi:hypothetical protein